MRRYFHYTCRHSLAAILDSGVILPLRQVMPPENAASPLLAGHEWLLDVCWFIDIPYPSRYQAGLTMHEQGCDRTEFRFAVTDDTLMIPWLVWCKDRVPREDKLNLYTDLRSMPGSWYVATVPVPVVLA